jgi:hypothetical protein
VHDGPSIEQHIYRKPAPIRIEGGRRDGANRSTRNHRRGLLHRPEQRVVEGLERGDEIMGAKGT